LIREGSGARLVKAIFSYVRANSPAILLITSIEDFCSNEESDFLRPIITELLINITPFNDQSSNLSVILTSSTPWASNNFMRAIRRRAEREAYVPLPDAVRRRAMLQRTVQFDSEREYSLAADLSEGMSFWEMRDIVRRAVLQTASSDSPASLLNAILSAFQSTVPNTGLRSIELFQAYVAERSD
jgi:SpoVK/Ycf46/Vps4 family AAA+-type ATPase